MSSCYWANELDKPKPKTENPGDNAQRRLRLDMGCNAITAATRYFNVKNRVGTNPRCCMPLIKTVITVTSKLVRTTD